MQILFMYSPDVSRVGNEKSMEKLGLYTILQRELGASGHWWSTLHFWVVSTALLIQKNMHNITLFFRGPKFRKAYNRIGEIRSLTRAPFMALTASAPPATTMHINRSLALDNPITITHNLNRPNIFLSVGKRTAVTVSLFLPKTFLLVCYIIV